MKINAKALSEGKDVKIKSPGYGIGGKLRISYATIIYIMKLFNMLNLVFKMLLYNIK